MNYEFHVGDYIETIDGKIGYITDINLAYSDIDVPYFDWITKEGVSLRQRIGLWAEQFGFVLVDTFKRIGQYDFTKKEKKKIEQLEKDLPIEMKCGDKVTIMKQYFDGNYNTIIYSTKMIDKINELVDAVNLLLDKSTES